MRRVTVGALSLGLLVVVSAPLLASTDYDDYPISSFPMFAADRGRQSAFVTAVAIDVDGVRRRLSPETLAETSQPVQAAVTMQRTVARGDAESLCSEIAERVGDDLVSVEVVTETHDTLEYFADEESLLDRTVHARCAVSTAR